MSEKCVQGTVALLAALRASLALRRGGSRRRSGPAHSRRAAVCRPSGLRLLSIPRSVVHP